MPVLEVAGSLIPYEIRRSSRARRIRITVRPGKVEVVAPRFTRASTIRAFVGTKSDWIARKLEALASREVLGGPQRFVSGARIPFRGRRYRLEVSETPAADAVRFRHAFQVAIPPALAGAERELAVQRLVMSWLRERALRDAGEWATKYGERLGARPSRIRIGNQKTLWGSCSARGVVSLNWRLVTAPMRVFEYVVVHELCHLRERNHGARFWALVGDLMPDYRKHRAWLKERAIRCE